MWDEFFIFFFESSESYRVFNYLHDFEFDFSGRENVSGGTVGLPEGIPASSPPCLLIFLKHRKKNNK